MKSLPENFDKRWVALFNLKSLWKENINITTWVGRERFLRLLNEYNENKIDVSKLSDDVILRIYDTLIWKEDKSVREQEWMKWKEDEPLTWKEDEPLTWKGDKSLREQEWMKWKEEKTDQRISFEKNNIEGFKEMFEKYTLNGEKMLVGRYTETEIEKMTRDDRIKLINRRDMRKDEAIYLAEKKNKIVKSDLIKLLKSKFEPKHLIKIGDETIYLSDVTEGHEANKRNFLVGYTSDWEIRFFYKSLSEGIRRSTDWYRRHDWYSKCERMENYSYETTTQVDHKIGEFFDSLPKMPVMGIPFYLGDKYDIPHLLKPSLEAKVQMKKIGNFEYDSAYDYYMGKSVNAVQEFYRNLKTDIILSWISETYSFKHVYLWEIHVDIVKAKLKDGTDIELHFWHAVNDNPNSVFIIRWDYAEWDVNSFGIKSKQLNIWPLCAKPIDYYDEQAPIDWRSNNFKRYGEDYVDIRALYQEMPLIKSYKEMIKKAENKSDTKSKNNPW